MTQSRAHLLIPCRSAVRTLYRTFCLKRRGWFFQKPNLYASVILNSSNAAWILRDKTHVISECFLYLFLTVNIHMFFKERSVKRKITKRRRSTTGIRGWAGPGLVSPVRRERLRPTALVSGFPEFTFPFRKGHSHGGCWAWRHSLRTRQPLGLLRVTVLWRQKWN